MDSRNIKVDKLNWINMRRGKEENVKDDFRIYGLNSWVGGGTA